MNFLSAEVEVKVDDSKLPTQLAKVRSAVTKTVRKISATFKRMATSFKTAFDKMVRIAKYSALIIAGALTFTAKAAMDQEQALAKLVVVLKSTGYAAGLSLKQLVAHADALQKVTIYADDTIENMQALLLTFKSIRGEIFMRTTEAILDLSKAMGQDLQQSVIQIGKAINDPILGMTALRRVGIQFTIEQEKMIKGLVESGKLFEAQKVILAELESQFGGMSRIVETGWGKLKQMWNALGEIAEAIGGALLPQIKESATAIKEWAERNTKRVGEWAKEAVRYVGLVKDAFVDWVSYLKQDFKMGVDMALRISLELFKGFWQASVTIMRGVGKEAANAFLVAFGDAIADWYDKIGKELWFLPGVSLPAKGVAALLRGKERAPVGQESKRVFEELKEIAEATAISIKSIMEEIEPKKTIREQYIEALRARIAMIDEELAEINKTMKETMEETLITPLKRAEEETKKTATVLKEIHQDIANAMARSWSNALDQMMFESKKFGDAMRDMFRSLLRMIVNLIIYQKVAEPIAQSIVGLIPGAVVNTAAPTPAPELQHGGVVERSGWAKVHKGETFSGVGGGKLEVNVNYSGQERPVISEAEFDFKRQVLNITMEAAEGNGPYRRSHNLRR